MVDIDNGDIHWLFPAQVVRGAHWRTVNCDGSKEARLTGRVIGERLLHQSIQFAGSRATLYLTIPLRPIMYHQPLTKLRELVRIKFDDLLFSLTGLRLY
jgi:hypothetical protein